MPRRATARATRAYADRFDRAQPGFFRELGRTGLTTSAVGFGGYRIHDANDQHREALTHALRGGCNLIDTSSNYTDGGSERLVGEVIDQLEAEGHLQREEVVVASKVGYAQGSNLEVLQKAQAQGDPFPDVVPYAEGCWHCIHPRFLDDQLQRSLDRLGLETIDVYLLHNPEYFLADAARRDAGDLESRRREYQRRLGLAFEWLETQVAAGRIGSYGISSNTFPSPADDPEHTSLEWVLELGEGLEAEHHFSTIQLPMNLLERGGWTERNGRGGEASVLELAGEAGLGVLINRPLNAFSSQEGSLVRLADFEVTDPSELEISLAEGLERACRREADLRDALTKTGLGGLAAQLADPLSWAEVLREQWRDLSGLESWRNIVEMRIQPSLGYALRMLLSRPEARPELVAAIREYREAMSSALASIDAHYRNVAQKRSEAIAEILDGLAGDPAPELSLSQRSLHLLVSLPQVTTVLVGMRRVEYVDDVLSLAEVPPAHRAHQLWEGLSEEKIESLTS